MGLLNAWDIFLMALDRHGNSHFDFSYFAVDMLLPKARLCLKKFSGIWQRLRLIGLSYTFVKDSHVRVDVLHERFSAITRTRIEILGICFLFLPFMFITLWELIPYP